jgi:hypothetical protein
MLAFHSNGLVDFRPAAVVEGPYRIEGSEMIFPPTAIQGPEQRQKMEFVGQDQLRLADVVFRRNGAAPDPSRPIVGEWVGRREMNGLQLEATYLFYPDGKYLFLLPFTTSPGRYSIQGSTIRLELPGNQVADEFRIAGDMLTSSGPGGSRYRFGRY